MARKLVGDSLKNEKGQSAVEYLLLLVVMATVITSLLANMKNKYLGDATKCDNSANSRKLLCIINRYISPSDSEKKFQRFPFKK